MNPKAYWVGVTSAFAAGGVLGAAVGTLLLEKKYREKLSEHEESMQNTLREFQKLHVLKDNEAPKKEVEFDIEFDNQFDEQVHKAAEAVEAITENLKEKQNFASALEQVKASTVGQIDLTPGATTRIVDADAGIDRTITVAEDGTMFVHEPDYNYEKAVDAIETPVETFVSGDVNAYGIRYIEQEEFEEDDGRLKYLVQMMFVGGNLMFLQDGNQIDDWAEKLGESILVDFFNLVPPGTTPVLYVRNERSGEDFEVVRVDP